jgi:hypothetical protein
VKAARSVSAVTAWQMDAAAVSMGDLIVGSLDPGNTSALSPAIEPVITAGEMAALLEAYGSSLVGLEATLEILTSENDAPLAPCPCAWRRFVGRNRNGEREFSITGLAGPHLARGTIDRTVARPRHTPIPHVARQRRQRRRGCARWRRLARRDGDSVTSVSPRSTAKSC